jgi:hypothetical protein
LREKTTTSPSGRDLGHYNLIIRLFILDDDDKNLNVSENF